MKKKIIIILAVVLALGGAAAYFFLFSSPAENVYSYYEPGDYFVTNIKDSRALIKTTIVLELNAPANEMDEINKYLKENNHVLRDIIVFTLRSKTEQELRAENIDETLRAEIVKSINEKMGIDYITSVYFNDYVIN
ncbi:MAG: flagellar basal body-associated FliL family protein [Christensenellales bacterium]|jgi:flagellar FliL protein